MSDLRAAAPPPSADRLPANPSRQDGAAAGIAEKRLATAMHLLRGWIWETDVEHRFRYMSDGVLSYAGRPPEWHYGRTREELGNTTITGDQAAEFRRQLEAREPFGPVEFQRQQNGEALWWRTIGLPVFDDAGAFLGYRGIAYEITGEMTAQQEKLEARAALVEALDILTATIDCLPLGVSVFDRHHRLAFANAYYYSLVDLPMTRFPTGSAFADIVTFLAERGEFKGGEVEDLIAMHLQIVARGEIHTFERTRPNGRRLEVKGVPLPGGGFVRTVTDVTARMELAWRLEAAQIALRRREEELADARAELERLRRPAGR